MLYGAGSICARALMAWYVSANYVALKVILYLPYCGRPRAGYSRQRAEYAVKRFASCPNIVRRHVKLFVFGSCIGGYAFGRRNIISRNIPENQSARYSLFAYYRPK